MYQLKIFFRNLLRNGIYSAINIGGLAVGLAAAILVFVWVYNEWSYDKFHAKTKQLYAVYNRATFDGSVMCWTWTPPVMGPTMKNDYPEIADMTRTRKATAMLFTKDDKKMNIPTSMADPGFLNMFNFDLLQGNKETALNNTYSVILTEKAAKRLFGNEEAMGKAVLLENDNRNPFTVTGIMENLPTNTVFDFEALIPIEYALVSNLLGDRSNWGNNCMQTYVELQPQTTLKQINESVRNITIQHTDNKSTTEVFLYPLAKQYLYGNFENGMPSGGRIENVRIFSLIALSILLIACINFMNLSTARSEKRAREVGVRKVMGAKYPSLIRLFLGESVLIAFFAGIIAVLIVKLSLPAYSALIGKPLLLNLGNTGFWLVGLVFILFTGLLAGSYPAFYLSSFLPVKVLKGVFKGERTLVAPRKILVVVQFTFSIFLIIATTVIYKQIHFAQSRDNGYRKEQLAYHPLSGDIGKNYELIRQELLNSGVAVSVTRTMSPMTEGWSSTGGFEWKGKNAGNSPLIDRYCVDADWAKTTGTSIIQGRDIDMYTYATDSTAMLLNEAAVKLMNFENPIGEIIKSNGTDWHVVGVVKDFILNSPYEGIAPMAIGGPKGRFHIMHIRFSGTNRTRDNLAEAERIFKKYNPDYPFECKFIDEEYTRKFEEEKVVGKLATCFAGLAIFISCLGLFGLSAYMAENRRKEIGVRKILGDSVSGIVALLSREFLILVLVSFLIAAPLAGWLMNQWLKEFAYRTSMPWWLFVVAAVLTIAIALFTVSFQAIKAATANPVKSIKTE